MRRTDACVRSGTSEKNAGLLQQSTQLKYRFIAEHAGEHPVRLLCGVLEVTPSGYYSWKNRPPSPTQKRNEALTREIWKISTRTEQRYGSPRIHRELQAQGDDVR